MAHRSARSSHRRDVSRIGVNAVNGDEALVEQAESSQTLDRTYTVQLDRVGDFARGFVHMNVDGGVVGIRELSAALERFVAHRVRGVRSHRDLDGFAPRVALEERFALFEVLGVVFRPGGGETDDDRGDRRAQTRAVEPPGGGFGKEVAVVGGRHARSGEFESGQE